MCSVLVLVVAIVGILSKESLSVRKETEEFRRTTGKSLFLYRMTQWILASLAISLLYSVIIYLRTGHWIWAGILSHLPREAGIESRVF